MRPSNPQTSTHVASTLAALAAVSIFLALPAQAQTAKKLKCDGCVKSKQIRDGGVRSRDLAPDAVFRRTLVVSPVGDGSDAMANGQLHHATPWPAPSYRE